MSPLKRPGVRQRPETIIALVDVVFFLLVFALLIGRMDATAPFQVAPPIAKNGVDLPAGGVTVTLGDGKMALEGLAMSPPDLRQQLAQRIADDPAMRIRLLRYACRGLISEGRIVGSAKLKRLAK